MHAFESCFARVFGGCCHCSSRALAQRVYLVPRLQRHQLHLALRKIPVIGGCRGVSRVGPCRVTLDDYMLLRSLILRTYGGELPTDSCRTTFLQTERAWMQRGRAGGWLWHQRRFLAVVAESDLTMKESRRVMVLTSDGDVHVEDASGQGREIEGIRNRALPTGISRGRAYAFRREPGDVQRRRAEEAALDRRHPGVPHPVDGFWWSLARLQGVPPVRGPPPAVARMYWRRSETSPVDKCG